MRSEESGIGLYYYGARWYSPVLGRFVQADTIVPLASQGTQAWDRYAGMNNNPIRFNDPSGHCAASTDVMIQEKNACWKYWDKLSVKYSNVWIDPLSFNLSELQVIGKALHIASAAFGGKENFAKAVGSFGITTATKPVHKLTALGITPPGLGVFSGTIYFADDSFAYFNTVEEQVNLVLHEIGHVFDFNGAHSTGIDPIHYKSQLFVDKFAPGCNVGSFGCVNSNSNYATANWFLGGASGGYNVGQGATGYGSNSSIDDFAESFAAYAWTKVDMTPVAEVNRRRLNLIDKIVQQVIK